MMFMLFMGFVYVALTLQQRATRQVQASASPHYTRCFARAPRRPSAYLCGLWARLRTELTRTASRTERPREGLTGAVEAPRPLRLSTELASPAFVFLCLIILNMFRRVRQLRIKHALVQKLGLRSSRASNHHGSSSCSPPAARGCCGAPVVRPHSSACARTRKCSRLCEPPPPLSSSLPPFRWVQQPPPRPPARPPRCLQSLRPLQARA